MTIERKTKNIINKKEIYTKKKMRLNLFWLRRVRKERLSAQREINAKQWESEKKEKGERKKIIDMKGIYEHREIRLKLLWPVHGTYIR